ncbi:FadR family transcriptional regulator [Amycolatopsis acidiphila]|uniref:FadR/GntR family transcriptional regulator n=1 Tax=Amycolatopsis acidiphila TaxID=715473 RepID=UPI00198AA058|nr:FadR/GntR family transcriptional regulator [Amycolatopsis acidiphila]UIJ59189.1 FadR family transcriptional regulator [Amycolatopsis acidiphila]GHG79032.1 GntR family transcriptional regulator [Amycolatopsis acidiphila]
MSKEARAFDPLPSARTADRIVRLLRDRIRSGELPVGDRLPSERDLCAQLNVSRLSLREALRVLEANGLIEVRMGARGGAFVTAPSTQHAGEGITDLLTTAGLSAANVTQARSILELGIIPVVIACADETDLLELDKLCDEAEAARTDGSYTRAMSLDFHLRVAAATHNPAIVMIMDSFRDAILMSIQEARHEGTQGVAEHRKFIDAVRARDADRAHQAMADHLRRTADAVGSPC